MKQGDVVIAKMQLAGAICIEAFADFPQMGRFILRDEGEFQISILNCLSFFVACCAF